MPPKWSPCKCDTSTASIDVGASPNRASPINDDAPQSSSTWVLALRSEIAAWRRPPLPKASPEPTNCTVIMSGYSIEHKSVALEHARSRRFRSGARQPCLVRAGPACLAEDLSALWVHLEYPLRFRAGALPNLLGRYAGHCARSPACLARPRTNRRGTKHRCRTSRAIRFLRASASGTRTGRNERVAPYSCVILVKGVIFCSPELRLLDMVSTTSWLAELTASRDR